jgi:hypothetical protein
MIQRTVAKGYWNTALTLVLSDDTHATHQHVRILYWQCGTQARSSADGRGKQERAAPGHLRDSGMWMRNTTARSRSAISGHAATINERIESTTYSPLHEGQRP